MSVILALGCSGNKKGNSVLIDIEKAVELSFNDVATNVRVVPIKSEKVLPGLKLLQNYGDELFAMDAGHSSILYFYRDSLISILNAVGNGHNEYNRIERFTYNPEERVLYVISQSKQTILWYSVPDMICIGRTSLDYDPKNIQIHNNEVFLTLCRSDSAYLIKFIDKNTGQMVRESLKVSGYSYVSCQEGLDEYKNGHYFTLIGNINHVLKVKDDLEIDTVFLYGFGKNSIPQNISDYQPYESNKIKDAISFLYSNESEKCLRGGYYMDCEDKDISFWFNKEQTRNSFGYYHLSKSDTIIIKSLKITGLNKEIYPNCLTDDGYITLFEGVSSSIINKEEQLTPLANQIVKAMNSQEDNNPVLLYYSLSRVC